MTFSLNFLLDLLRSLSELLRFIGVGSEICFTNCRAFSYFYVALLLKVYFFINGLLVFDFFNFFVSFLVNLYSIRVFDLSKTPRFSLGTASLPLAFEFLLRSNSSSFNVRKSKVSPSYVVLTNLSLGDDDASSESLSLNSEEESTLLYSLSSSSVAL